MERRGIRKASPTDSMTDTPDTHSQDGPAHFIREIIKKDIAGGRTDTVVTRFPPEPNGYLHIGHAKSINLNFGMAAEFGGRCNLRFDDTNPVKEEHEYIDAIQEDVRWLSETWDGKAVYASDYFQQLYDWAEHLIENGDAFVDDLSAEEMREYRGTLTEPGKESPHRTRSVEENLDLFRRMRAGEFANGAKTLRAKIDMSSGNINMRDPVIYRVLHESHPRTGDAWCIYPTYDFAHGQSDAIEGVSHSLCTLEFADHRPLYDWLIAHLPVPCVPEQTEFARLNLTNTVLSKRKLMQLVQTGAVDGWDDPRMPTLKGLRRRGFPAGAVREFAKGIGVARADSVVEYGYLEACARVVLNRIALRRMAVLNPVKVVIENYPEGETELLDAVNNPEDESDGIRQVAFSREIYIERDDFMEDAPKKFFRLSPGKEVRLRYAYFITCTDVIKDENGEITELRATYDPASRGGDSPDGRKVRGTLHWVDANSHKTAEVRRYGHLFTSENPGAEEDFLAVINPDSKKVVEALIEPALADDPVGTQVQFERLGYFCVDLDSTPGRPVFNEIVALRDSWKKIQKSQG